MIKKMAFTSIALSGVPRAGKTTLMTALSNRLGWEIFYIGGEFDKRHQAWLKGHPEMGNVNLGEWWNKYVTREEIVEINNRGRDFLRKGEVILDSRYAPVNAQGVESCIVVGVFCPIDVRSRRIYARRAEDERYRGKTLPEIAIMLEQRQKFERDRGNEIYGYLFGGEFLYTDHKHYHKIIDSSTMTVEEEVESVVHKLGS